MRHVGASLAGAAAWSKKMIKIASMSLDINLSLYSNYLKGMGIVHRIAEESGSQSIYVANSENSSEAKHILNLYLNDQLGTSSAFVEEKLFPINVNLRGLFFESPITICIIGLTLLLAIVTSLGSDLSVYSVLLYPLVDTSSLLASLGELKSILALTKTVTPMFLHFGELHLVFNMLWMWYFGKQLEQILPSWLFLSLVILISFTSNTVQYLVSGYNNFGGMSGVIYGLVGFSWVVSKFQIKKNMVITNNLFIFFIVSLVLMEIFASSWIATAAHVGGLLSGIIIGAIYIFLSRLLFGSKHG